MARRMTPILAAKQAKSNQPEGETP
jgi:hypothetical protein